MSLPHPDGALGASPACTGSGWSPRWVLPGVHCRWGVEIPLPHLKALGEEQSPKASLPVTDVGVGCSPGLSVLFLGGQAPLQGHDAW